MLRTPNTCEAALTKRTAASRSSCRWPERRVSGIPGSRSDSFALSRLTSRFSRGAQGDHAAPAAVPISTAFRGLERPVGRPALCRIALVH
jgi:hypothetical protein